MTVTHTLQNFNVVYLNSWIELTCQYFCMNVKIFYCFNKELLQKGDILYHRMRV